MAGEHHRAAAGHVAAQDRPDVLPGHRVDGLERLVQDHQPRRVDEGAGQADLLGHAGRVLHHQGVGVVGQPERLEQLASSGRRCRRRAPGAAARRSAAARRRSAGRRASCPSGSIADQGLGRRRDRSTRPGPRISARPASGRSRPVAIDRVVVLPAPLGPTSPNRQPGRTVRCRSSTAILVSEALDQSGQGQRRRSRRGVRTHTPSEHGRLGNSLPGRETCEVRH